MYVYINGYDVVDEVYPILRPSKSHLYQEKSIGTIIKLFNWVIRPVLFLQLIPSEINISYTSLLIRYFPSYFLT